MCLLCTKLYLRNKLVSKLIGKKLTVDVLDYFPVQLSYGVISNGSMMKKHDEKASFETFFYEVINSPFLLWKFYFNIISRIAFN